MRTVYAPGKITVPRVPASIVPVQAGQQEGRVPGHNSSQRQEEDPSAPAKMRERKWQRGIGCAAPQHAPVKTPDPDNTAEHRLQVFPPACTHRET